MRKVYLGAAVVMMFGAVGCGSSSGTDGGAGGGGVTPCKTDADCTGGGICNTIGEVCMTKCSQASDCPSTAKNCAMITGGTSASVCQCSTDALCGGGTNYCNPIDLLCEVQCSSSSGCTGYEAGQTRECTNSQCLPGVADGGADGGANCGGTCTAMQTCDEATQMCVSNMGNTCTPSAGDTCMQTDPTGDFCNSTNSMCEAAASCVSGPNPTLGMSPVIWGTTKTGSTAGDGTTCTGNVDTFTTNYFLPAGVDLPSSAYNTVIELKSDGTIPSPGSLNPPTGNTYDNTGMIGSDTITWTLCSDNTGVAAIVVVSSSGSPSNSDCVTGL